MEIARRLHCAGKQGHQRTAFQLKPRLPGRKIDERRALIGLFTMAGHKISMNNSCIDKIRTA